MSQTPPLPQVFASAEARFAALRPFLAKTATKTLVIGGGFGYPTGWAKLVH